MAKVLCHETNMSGRGVILFSCLLPSHKPTQHLWQNYTLPSSSRSELSSLLPPKLSSTYPKLLVASLQERLVKLRSTKKSSSFFPSVNKEAGTIHKWGSRVSSTATESNRFFSNSAKFLIKLKEHKIKSYKNSFQSTLKCVQVSSHFRHVTLAV